MPVLEDLRAQLVAVDEQAALVVEREVHRPDRVVAAGARAASSPAASSSARGDLRVVLALEEAELPPVVLMDLVEARVDLGGDPADDPVAAASEEVLGVGVLEVRVAAAVEVALALADQRRRPTDRRPRRGGTGA